MGCAHIFLTDSLSFKFSIFTALTPLKYRQQKKQNICKLAVYISNKMYPFYFIRKDMHTFQYQIQYPN